MTSRDADRLSFGNSGVDPLWSPSKRGQSRCARVIHNTAHGAASAHTHTNADVSRDLAGGDGGHQKFSQEALKAISGGGVHSRCVKAEYSCGECAHVCVCVSLSLSVSVCMFLVSK